MQRESVWEGYLSSSERKIKRLNGDIRTDVLIIGGGIAGILCAFRLQAAKVSCVVVEKGDILAGVTRNTTAKISAQHGLNYGKILKSYGRERAKQYYAINQMAVEAYRWLAEQIPCDLENKTAYVYSTNDRQKVEREAQVYELLGIPFVWQEHTPLPVRTCGALGMKGQAQYHPLKLLDALAERLQVYENTRVIEILEGKAVTERGTVEADQIVLATHFPMVNIPGGYFLKLYQHRSYELAIEGGPQLNGMYLDEKKGGLSFRNYQNYLLLGGGGHKTGANGGGYAALREVAALAYPGKRIAFSWAAQDCMSLDGIPYIGCHSKGRSRLFVATGFNKWGMTGAMASAIVLEELLTKGTSEFEELFSPQRTILHPQLLVNAASAAGNLLRPGRRCTHMGCALQWNPQERTWDCPCHGSRFGEDGTILENPAKKEL